MLIKPQQLHSLLQKVVYPMYFIVGTNRYQMSELTELIKKTRQTAIASDEKQRVVDNADDWVNAFEEANSYCLFYDATIMTLIHEKKTMDAACKALIQRYLLHTNPQSTLIIQAPLLSAKALSWLNHADNAAIVPVTSPNASQMTHWISMQLNAANLRTTPEIPLLIQQLTQGNQHACEQLIEKLTLSQQQDALLTEQTVLINLMDQSEYSLYELGDALLQNDALKALRVLRFAQNNRIEPTLVLWVIAQEPRVLLQLHERVARGESWSDASAALKIWSSKLRTYQVALSRFDKKKLKTLLSECQRIDLALKTDNNQSTWVNLERIVLSFFTKIQTTS